MECLERNPDISCLQDVLIHDLRCDMSLRMVANEEVTWAGSEFEFGGVNSLVFIA